MVAEAIQGHCELSRRKGVARRAIYRILLGTIYFNKCEFEFKKSILIFDLIKEEKI